MNVHINTSLLLLDICLAKLEQGIDDSTDEKEIEINLEAVKAELLLIIKEERTNHEPT